MDMPYRFKEAFSLRGEIGTCPVMEIEIDVIDKTQFFIRPYYVQEEDKQIVDKLMKRLCHLGILKEVFSAYPSAIVLISRKLTHDKRCVSDIRHINTRIANTILAFPLVRDTFSMLGSSTGEILSMINSKDIFHSLRLTEELKKYCRILPYMGSASY